MFTSIGWRVGWRTARRKWGPAVRGLVARTTPELGFYRVVDAARSSGIAKRSLVISSQGCAKSMVSHRISWPCIVTQFEQLQQAFAKQPDDPICVHMAKLKSFRTGLFAGEDIAELPRDNLALERWFRHPKSHERKIHGHQHTGTRIVQEGPTLLPTLDAHLSRTGIFTSDELKPYANATMPESQKASRARHGIMVKGRSKKKEESSSCN